MNIYARLPEVTMVAGSTIPITMLLVDKNGNPRNGLNYSTITFAMRNFINDAEAISLILQSGSSQVVIERSKDGFDNLLKIVLRPNNTVNLDSGVYKYEVRVMDSSENQECLGQGYIHLIGSIYKGTTQNTEPDEAYGTNVRYIDTLTSRDELPTSGMNIGDMYDIEEDGINVVWNGWTWDAMSSELSALSEDEIRATFDS